METFCFVAGLVIATLASFAVRKRTSDVHECEEFTQWTACDNEATVTANNGKALPESERYDVSYHFQERRCTLCGKVFQEALAYSSHFDSDDDDDEDDEDDDFNPEPDYGKEANRQ